MKRLQSNNEQAGRSAANIGKSFKKVLIIFMVLCIIFNSFTKIKVSSADANSQVTVKIDYLEQMAYITPGTNTKLYFSSDDGKTWELIEPFGVLDISNLMQTKADDLYFKGNKDLKPTIVTLQALDSTLKATYSIVNGEGLITLTGFTSAVEYRKGTSGQWKPASTTMPTASYEMRGATLYFRTIATTVKRAGKEISLKVAKKPSAPSVKLDGSKLYITGLTVGATQYRVGDNTVWLPFSPTDTKVKSIDLTALFAVTGSALNTPIPAGTVEFRTMATTKKVASAIKVIGVPLQPSTPENVTLVGTTLSIQDTNLKKAYEYTKVEKLGVLNIKTARWTSITAARSVVIPKALVDEKIIVRVKSIVDPVSKILIPASTYKELKISSITASTK